MASRRRPHGKDSGDSSEDEGKAAVGFNKRRKTTESTEEVERRLESLICRVGEKSSSSLESNLEGLSAVLEADLSNFKSQILQILMLCSYQLPEKCSIYTTLVGLLNKQNYNCGSELIDMLMAELKRLISTNQYRYAQSVVQFLGDLVNCNVVSAASMMALLATFVDVCKQESGPQSRKDWYVHTVLATLPWVGAALNEKKSGEMDVLFSKIYRYMHQRKKLHHKLLRVWSTDDPHPQEEYLDCLFAQISKFREDGWVEDIIMRPYRAFAPNLVDAYQHNLPPFIVPPHIEGKSCYPIPSVVFRMFDYTDCPEGPLIPGNHAIERWIIEENIRHLIKTYKADKKECAQRLLSMPGHEKIPLSHMVIECLFGNMFRLPDPPNPLVFYTTTFIELCKLQPSMMPQILALASDMLFERLDFMNITCIDRLVNWFSHHLSNFQFRWSWDDWIDCMGLDLATPRPKFIKEVLEKCLRLSYHQRLCEIVSPEFQPLFPVEPKIQYKYTLIPGSNASEQEHAANGASQRIIAAIKNKCTDDDMIVLLEEIAPVMTADGDNVQDFNPLRLELFLHSLLYLAQKSFSHSFSALSKFHKVLKWASASEEGKLEVLRITRNIWQNHTQMLVVVVDKMLRLGIVDCASVAKWIFSPQMATDFTRLFAWEIMHSTIRRMNAHRLRLDAELVDMRSRERAPPAEQKMDQDSESDMMGTYDAFAPNEDEVKALQEQVENSVNEQKKLFLIIFQRFIMILSDHLVRCEGSGVDLETPWYKNTVDRLKEVFLLHKDTVKQYMSTLENLLFTGDLDPRILTIFQQFAFMAAST